MVDSHCHLNFRSFDGREAAVLGRARAAGVTGLIVPSTNVETSKKAVALARRFSEVYGAVGIHPIHAGSGTLEGISELYTLTAAPKVVAIGECGLDWYLLTRLGRPHRYPDQETQKSLLGQMLNLAEDAGKPLILHCREAYEDLWSFLKSHSSRFSGVLHCFQGTVREVEKFLDLGFLIGFTGTATFGNPPAEVIKAVPLDRLLIETDAPYLAPAPVQDKENEPANLVYTAEFLAATFNVALSKIVQATSENAERLFRISARQLKR